jgi:hypothetical protein
MIRAALNAYIGDVRFLVATDDPPHCRARSRSTFYMNLNISDMQSQAIDVNSKDARKTIERSRILASARCESSVLEVAHDGTSLDLMGRCNREATTFDLRLHSPALVTTEPLAELKVITRQNPDQLLIFNKNVREPNIHNFIYHAPWSDTEDYRHYHRHSNRSPSAQGGTDDL